MNDKINDYQVRLTQERSMEEIMICTIEEMSELTKVLTKYMRNSEKYHREDLVEEMSHVLLQIEVLRQCFNITDSEIEDEQLDVGYRCFNK
mgnify:CR=1 FL=1